MARENVGEIYYTVEADTAPLVKGGAAAEKAVDALDKRLTRSGKAANDASFQMTKTARAIKSMGRQSSVVSGVLGELTRALAGIVSIKTAVEIIRTAEAYNEMAERIRMATSSVQEYRMVQARLLANANSTYRSLDEAQEVYIRTADSLRSMGYETSQVLDITDSLSYLFVTNAASADRANNAISAFSKSISKGKVEADSWESILTAVPTIVDDIAAAANLSTEEVRALGAAGKLTARQLSEGLSKSLEKNRAASAGMATTVKDAFTALRNNLTVYIGEANQAAGVTGMLSQQILKVAEAVRSADPADLVREIDALVATFQLLDEMATEWIEPFMTGTEDATNFLSDSFAEGVLATAKEIDGLAGIFQGAVGAIESLWEGLAHNIPTFFFNAWQDVLADAAGFVNSLSDMLNKPLQALGMDGIGKVDWGSAPRQAVIDLTEAAVDGWNNATKGIGAYEKVVDRLSSKAINRAITAWEEEYAQGIEKTNQKKKRSVELTDAQKKAAKELQKAQEENQRVIDQLATSLYEAGLEGEALALTKARAQLNKFATPEEVAQVEALARALYSVQQAEANTKLLGQMDPIAGAQMEFETQLANLRKLNEAKLLEDQRYLELKAQAEEDYEARSRALQEENFRRQSSLNALLIDSLNHFGATATDTLLELASGATKGEDALRALGTAILREGVDSLVQMGVQYAKNLLIGKAAGTAATAFGVAQAGVLASAWAPAAALASLASFGANAGPAGAALTSTTALASGLALAGGRRYGGPVQAGKMYRVNEGGAPEVLNTANGQQFLIPNRSGQVVSNRDATAGSPAPAPSIKVNLIEDSTRGGEVRANQVGDDTEVDVFVADIRGGGRRAETLEQTYGLKRRGM